MDNDLPIIIVLCVMLFVSMLMNYGFIVLIKKDKDKGDKK